MLPRLFASVRWPIGIRAACDVCRQQGTVQICWCGDQVCDTCARSHLFTCEQVPGRGRARRADQLNGWDPNGS